MYNSILLKNNLYFGIIYVIVKIERIIWNDGEIYNEKKKEKEESDCKFF